MVAWNLNQIFPSFFRIIIDKFRIFAMIRRKQNLVIYLFLLFFRRLAAVSFARPMRNFGHPSILDPEPISALDFPEVFPPSRTLTLLIFRFKIILATRFEL